MNTSLFGIWHGQMLRNGDLWLSMDTGRRGRAIDRLQLGIANHGAQTHKITVSSTPSAHVCVRGFVLRCGRRFIGLLGGASYVNTYFLIRTRAHFGLFTTV